LHDLAFFVNPEWFSKPFSLWYRFIIPILARKSRKILTVSMFSKGEIIRILKQPAEKIIVAPNASSQLDSGHSEPVMYGEYLLFVGSVDPRKNLITLINAFKSINQGRLKLVIAGMVNKNFGSVDLDHDEDIIYLGKVSDAHLAALYKNAVAFVYPSLYEGFGIPPLEAMQHGCPVLVSNSSSLPEVCGDAAIYFSPYNTEELAEKIKLISENENLRTQLKQKGLKRVMEFSWFNSANIIKNAIDDLN
ncbi:MAG: glycosyltransferase family 1 protein, partial [Pedobacter agri]